MQITNETPRAARTIGGVSVNVIQPFAEGQTLTPATAAMLNQTLAENFSNNLRKAFADAAAEAEKNGQPVPDYQAMCDVYMAEYEPGVRKAGSGEPRVTDPVEREARKIAKAKIVDHLKAQGIKPADVDMATLVNGVFESNREALMKEGARVVKALEAARKSTDEIVIELG